MSVRRRRRQFQRWWRYVDRNIKLDPQGFAPRWVERGYNRFAGWHNARMNRALTSEWKEVGVTKYQGKMTP